MLNLQVLASVAIFILSSLSFADCGISQVKIQGATKFEMDTSCTSLTKVVNLFKNIGLEVEPKVKLFFDKQALFRSGNEVVPVYGYFDDETYEIHVTTFENKNLEDNTPFGLKWTKAHGASYVLHEMTHLVVAGEISNQNRLLHRVWHEFMAYAVQLELMDQSMREKILAQYPNLKPFENPSEVSLTYYELDQDMFAVKAYKSMHSWGGVSFLKKVIDGEVSVAVKIEHMDLVHSPLCILEAVARRTETKLLDTVPYPKLFPSSTTSFEQFKKGAGISYPEGYVITYYANFYVMENNEIYVNNLKPFVGRRGRTSDDVLAHELTHYIQHHYKRLTKEDAFSDTAESYAISVQTWFRETFMIQNPKEEICPNAKTTGKKFSKDWEF